MSRIRATKQELEATVQRCNNMIYSLNSKVKGLQDSNQFLAQELKGKTERLDFEYGVLARLEKELEEARRRAQIAESQAKSIALTLRQECAANLDIYYRNLAELRREKDFIEQRFLEYTKDQDREPK